MRLHQQAQVLEPGPIHRQPQLKTLNVPINLIQIRSKKMKMAKFLSILQQDIIIQASSQLMESFILGVMVNLEGLDISM